MRRMPTPGMPRKDRLVPALFVLVGIGLLPWTLYLAVALPSHHRTPHWDVTWAGFDVMLMIALVTTAVAALRHSHLLPVAAGTAGGLLLADAWFDCLTAGGGGDLALALGLAFGVELPLAALCLWIVLDKETFYKAADRLLD